MNSDSIDTWELTELSELIEIKHGYAFEGEHFNTEGRGLRLLTPAHFHEEGGFRDVGKKQKYYDGPIPNDYVLAQNALLVVMTEQATGLLGSPLLVPESGVYLHNQRLGLVGIVQPGRVERAFLFHALNQFDVRKHVSVTASGTKVRHSSPDKIASASIMLPTPLVQKRLASILNASDVACGTVSDWIHAAGRRRTALLQQLLTGKRRFPGFAKTATIKSTKFGTLPKDWEYPAIGDIAHQHLQKSDDGRARPVLSCTKHRGLVDSLAYFGKQMFSDDLSTYKVVRRGQFAYATNHIDEGSIGYQELHDEAVISPMYTVFQTRGDVNDKFLFLLFKSELYRHIFASNTSASVDRRGGLRWDDFARIHVPLPTRAEQDAIVAMIEVADRELALLSRLQTAYRAQKRGLMQQLLTGKRRVPMPTT